MKLTLSARADQDILEVLQETLRLFGPAQVDVYSELLDRALDLVAEDPRRPSSIDRSEILPGLRSFHIGLAAARRRGGSHVLYCLRVSGVGKPEVRAVRVLHQSMEPSLHVRREDEEPSGVDDV